MVHIVYTQSLENYGDSTPFWKFKGGSIFLCRAEREQDAIALVLARIVADGMGKWEYPKGAFPFATEAEARASLESWERVTAELG